MAQRGTAGLSNAQAAGAAEAERVDTFGWAIFGFFDPRRRGPGRALAEPEGSCRGAGTG